MLKVKANIKPVLTGVDSFSKRLRDKAVPLVLSPFSADVIAELQARITRGHAGGTGGFDISGNAIKSNAPATIKRKLRLGQTVDGRVKSLVATGHMVNDIYAIKLAGRLLEPTVQIRIPRDRLQVLQYLRDKGYKNFFGLPVTINGQPIGARARYYMRIWLNDALRRESGLRAAGYGG